jgi:hypothetical protein
MSDLNDKKEQTRIGSLKKNLYQKNKDFRRKDSVKLSHQKYNVNESEIDIFFLQNWEDMINIYFIDVCK